jgi:hypothetical protein
MSVPTTKPTATAGGPATIDAAPRPSSRLARTTAALCLAGAGAIIFAGFLATPWEGNSTTAAGMRAYLAHPVQGQIAATVLHFGYLLLVPAAFTLARMSRRGARRLSNTGLVLSVLGAGLSGLVVTDFFEIGMAQHLPLATAVRVYDATSGYALGTGLIARTTALGAVIGLVLLAAAAWRASWVSWVPAATILAGFGAALMGTTPLLGGIGSGLACVGLTLLAMRVRRASDAEWEDGRPA